MERFIGFECIERYLEAGMLLSKRLRLSAPANKD